MARTLIDAHRTLNTTSLIALGISLDRFIGSHTRRTYRGSSWVTFGMDFRLAAQKIWNNLGQLVQRDITSAQRRWTSEEREALQELIQLALFAERSYTFIMIAIAGVSVWKMSEWMMGGREQRTGASGSAAYTRGLLSEGEAWQWKRTENGTARQSG